MEKIKEKLHIGNRRKSQPDNDAYAKEGGFGTIEGTYSIQSYTVRQIACWTSSLGTHFAIHIQWHNSCLILTVTTENRDSIDSELAAMPPQERVAYLKEFEDSDKTGEPKKGGLIEKLIARGNKRTEDQIERESKEREAAHRDATHAQIGPGVGASTHSAVGGSSGL